MMTLVEIQAVFANATVIPAQAEIQWLSLQRRWVPVFTGTTNRGASL
jgi:hypothetical protein